ncbi:hypothetical protein IPL68_03895 [Candidatus Saccharibacteria bacterium]|nr:MAG: hypothetical protein IPL68_03895 [Candidatus Saccharibacteria bacterium]
MVGLRPAYPERFRQVRNVVLAADYYLPSKAEFLETWEVSSVEEGFDCCKNGTAARDNRKDGSRGAHYLVEGSFKTVPAVEGIHSGNVTGAGDTFNAGFIAAMKQGQSLQLAIKTVVK